MVSTTCSSSSSSTLSVLDIVSVFLFDLLQWLLRVVSTWGLVECLCCNSLDTDLTGPILYHVHLGILLGSSLGHKLYATHNSFVLPNMISNMQTKNNLLLCITCQNDCPYWVTCINQIIPNWQIMRQVTYNHYMY